MNAYDKNMTSDIMDNFASLPEDVYSAAKHIIGLVSKNLLSLIQEVNEKTTNENINDEAIRNNARSKFLLYCNQVSKIVISLLTIFKKEFQTERTCHATRQFLMDRLKCCCENLLHLRNNIGIKKENVEVVEFGKRDLFRNSFIKWLDDVFDLLGDLAQTFSHDVNFEKYNDVEKDKWRQECKDEVGVLCGALNETLLSAMTLNQCCQNNDQNIVKVRCQVVLRETRNLLSEVFIQNDVKLDNLEGAELKETFHFTSIKMSIDVLKESLYALETSVNNAILALILECFQDPYQEMRLLKDHVRQRENCDCNSMANSYEDGESDCKFIRRCDLLYDRIIEIGSFAATCSTDDKKVLPLKSSLTSLEALEDHLIPYIASCPDSDHTEFLCSLWDKEVTDIKNTVYLIVDPVPMVELSYDMLQEKIISLQKSISSDGPAFIKMSISIGQICSEFFEVYLNKEPKALGDINNLVNSIGDLRKAVRECQAYYKVADKNSAVNCDPKLMKRLKLLFTILKRILKAIKTVDKDDISFSDERSSIAADRNHRTNANYATDSNYQRKVVLTNVVTVNADTFVKTKQKCSRINNSDKQTFIQAVSLRLQNARNGRLRLFPEPIEIDSILQMDASNIEQNNKKQHPTPFKNSDKTQLYSFGKGYPKKDVPLRELMFRNMLSSVNCSKSITGLNRTVNSFTKSSCDTSMNLQITEILDQLTDLSNTLSSVHKPLKSFNTKGFSSISIVNIDCDSTAVDKPREHKFSDSVTEGVLKLSVNEKPTPSRDSWSIEIKSESANSSPPTGDGTKQKSVMNFSDIGVDLSFGSEVDTPQRIIDLKFLEDKLAALKKADVKN